jgi:hypothetical protein
VRWGGSLPGSFYSCLRREPWELAGAICCPPHLPRTSSNKRPFCIFSFYFPCHTFCALCSFCSFYSLLSKLFIMSDARFFAMLCDVQLRTDSTATPESRTFFSSEAPIQHLIEESSLTFAPGLADMIRSRNTPSVQRLRACSVLLSGDDLKLKWIIHL